MSVGHAVLWNNMTNATTTSGLCEANGYDVTFARTVATTANHAGLFAGIVAGRDIAGGDFGSIQCYGQIDSVYVSAAVIDPPYWGTAGNTAWNDTTLTTLVLRPAGLYGVTTGAATNAGYLGIQSLITTVSITTEAALTLDLRPLWPAPYVYPLGGLMRAGVATTAVTTATSATATATCKAFIRCM
jgi:hypothetical protein